MSARMPKIASLRIFIEVMRVGTIAKVAEQMHLTPSAASRMLTALESDLQLQLFRRERQRLIPTEAAETFLPEAVRALSVMDELPHISDAIRDGTTKDQLIRILSFSRFAEEILPAATARYYDTTGSNARMNITVEARHSLNRWAASRMFDIALTTMPVVHTSVRGELITEFPLCVTLPRDHQLSAEREVPVEALTNAPLSLIEKDSILCKRISKVFDEAGLVPNIRQESSTMDVSVRVGLATGSLSLNDGIFSKSLLGETYVLRRLKTAHSVAVGFVVPIGQEAEGAVSQVKDAIRAEVIAYRRALDRILEPE